MINNDCTDEALQLYPTSLAPACSLSCDTTLALGLGNLSAHDTDRYTGKRTLSRVSLTAASSSVSATAASSSMGDFFLSSFAAPKFTMDPSVKEEFAKILRNVAASSATPDNTSRVHATTTFRRTGRPGQQLIQRLSSVMEGPVIRSPSTRPVNVIDVNQLPSAVDSDSDDGNDMAEPSFALYCNGFNESRRSCSELNMVLGFELLGRGRAAAASCDVSWVRATEEECEGTMVARKKMRLSKEQSALLEGSFKEHPTLNPMQKAALAKELSLQPRQVEVWFQNRRARTKLKQTEVDCEVLRRCCESLTKENSRLHREVQELRAIKATPPTCIVGGGGQGSAPSAVLAVPAATLTMCPSCERINAISSSHKKPNQHKMHTYCR